MRIDRHIVSGAGTVPVSLGAVSRAYTLDLLNMTGSGYNRASILPTTKIGALRFIDRNILRVAVAEYGKFQSTSMLVFDINVETGMTLPILGTYEYRQDISDYCFKPFFAINETRELLSVHILPSGSVVLAGREGSDPFLMSWNGHFGSPVFYKEIVSVHSRNCGIEKSLFSFPLPVSHKIGGTVETSYSILQDDGNNLIVLVTGIRENGEIATLVPSGLVVYGFAKFDPNNLDLIGISYGSGNSYPDILDPSSAHAGLVGQSEGSLFVQFVGERMSPCGRKHSSVFLDAILRTVDANTYQMIKDSNYKDALGSLNGIKDGEVTNAAGAVYSSLLDDIILRSESNGILSLKEQRFFSSAKSIAQVVNSEDLYSLEVAHSDLRLTVYTS